MPHIALQVVIAVQQQDHIGKIPQLIGSHIIGARATAGIPLPRGARQPSRDQHGQLQRIGKPLQPLCPRSLAGLILQQCGTIDHHQRHIALRLQKGF